MKLITRISGIINFLIVLAILVVAVIVFFNNSGDDRLVSILLLLPATTLSIFLFRYKIGFESVYQEDSRYKNYFYVLLIGITSILLLLGISLSTTYFIKEYQKKKLVIKYAESIKWEKDTGIYNLNADLNTKYSDRYVLYNLQISSDSLNSKYLDGISGYTINLMDKDGYVIDEILINTFTRIINDHGNTIGHKVNSKYWMDISDYSRIKSFDLTYREK
jgi:hypothetical protein